MAATKKDLDELFAAFEAKLPNRGYFLHYQFHTMRPCLMRHTAKGDVEISERMTITPMFNWLSIVLKGIDIALIPVPSSEKCPICEGKLMIYESIPIPRWTFLCSGCEETGTMAELEEIAQTKGE